MTNYTTTYIMEGLNYNLTGIVSDTAIESPAQWFANFSALLHYLPATIFLIAFGVLIFMILKSRNDSDSESLAYSGVVTCFIGVLFFVIQAYSGIKILAWEQFIPFVILTGLFIFVHMGSKNY